MHQYRPVHLRRSSLFRFSHSLSQGLEVSHVLFQQIDINDEYFRIVV